MSPCPARHAATPCPPALPNPCLLPAPPLLPVLCQVDKAGADALFRDPSQKSSNVGVTVYPVTIDRLEQVR